MEIYNERFKAVRERKGLTVEEFSAVTDIPVSVIQAIENGTTQVEIEAALLVSTRLQVNLEYLFGWTDLLE